MENLLKFFYLNNFHKVSFYLAKFIFFFNKNIKLRTSFYKFFKKRKIYYNRKILLSLYKPRVFIFNLNVDTLNLIKKIYNYENIFKVNSYTLHENINIFQSEHDLNKKKEFLEIKNFLEDFINSKISTLYGSEFFQIKKMWFVITKKAGIIKKHSHLDSDLSGVLYLNVDENNIDRNDGLKIYNYFKHLEIFKYCTAKNKFIKTVIEDSYYIFKPKVNDLIIFNSYLEHSVMNYNSKIKNRISLPFDLEIFIK